MIRKYSLKKDGKILVSKNFSVSEFSCKDGSDEVYIDTKLCEILQKIRDHFKSPVTINSAYRTPSYNAKVGGVANSQHTKGAAADIIVKGIESRKVAEYVESIMPNYGGIGLYSNFVHIDTRQNRSRWENYGTEKVVKTFEKQYISVDDAIYLLIKKGIISEPNKWNKGVWSQEDVKWLIRKVGTFINEN